MHDHTHASNCADLRLPYHLRPGALIVLTGPAQSARHEAIAGIWRAANGLGHGPKPLYDPAPAFTQLPSPETLASAGRAEHEVADAVAANARLVVRPAQDSGRAVFMDGWYWEAWSEATGRPHPATGLQPSLIGVITGEPCEEDPLANPVEVQVDSEVPIVRLVGHGGQVFMALTGALLHAGLFASSPSELRP
jgi:hypothetical protein